MGEKTEGVEVSFSLPNFSKNGSKYASVFGKSIENVYNNAKNPANLSIDGKGNEVTPDYLLDLITECDFLSDGDSPDVLNYDTSKFNFGRCIRFNRRDNKRDITIKAGFEYDNRSEDAEGANESTALGKSTRKCVYLKHKLQYLKDAPTELAAGQEEMM